ncbi:MAG TPA: hypothetical protein VNI54_02640 [Thermoanaerobaculia bacterium]|nr:hypothetical protein [Thermoanaerobaculia bacterium]
MKSRLIALLLLAACATQPPKPPALAPPDAVSPAVLDALCGRLRMDAIASAAPLTVVNVTRPLATQQSMGALAMTVRGRVKGGRIAQSVTEANREIVLQTDGTSCTWRPIAPAALARHQDEMVLELSAPMVNAFSPREGGLFARVTVGGEGASWYWVTLVPYGGQWAVRGVSVLGH